ncbi:FGGY-family carbohydrate kinase [Secundilactobacillus mixtipabuli]|uniref:L-xylulose/3-keto-L-gulonate kinase n=1 Tax=Secundilactobacillus mixtipabuli TaxID=1435342 RepID=A0A1Z5I9M4_9LACO|nr:FGGY-family carbohydrate kinase [Secundilactobacillus mixtipabuli]GAW98506.1 L-xylulose/3-keto-L-gulonate kinase [Secundilactobacillus mixtipabuli]
MTDYYLTVDNGGTNTKSIIFDSQGSQVACTSFSTPKIENISGYHEIDLELLWDKIADAIQETIQKAGIIASDIKAVTPVGHGKGLYVLDEHNRIFCHGILSTDNRATQIAEQFESRINEIYDISLQHIMPSQAPVLLNWMKVNEPAVYQNIGTVLSAKDFIRFKLTNCLAQEYGDASGNNFLNLSSKQYDKELFNFFGIPECLEKMPKLVKSTDIVGEITEAVAQKTGLNSGTPVTGGLFDIHACTLATGVLNTNTFSTIAGTWNINVYPSDKPSLIESNTMNSLFPTGQYLIESSSPTSAGNLEMILKLLMSEERNNAKNAGISLYEMLEKFLSETNANYAKTIFLPFLYGSNVNSTAEGAFLGIRSTTTKSELIRSVYEGIVFAHRQHIEQLISILGHRPQVIRLSGGATNSVSWVQIFADILKTPIELVDANELGGLGGAIVGAVATGYYATLSIAIQKMVSVIKRFEPSAHEASSYDQKYQVYRLAIRSCAPLWNSLNQTQKGLGQYEFTGNL